MAQENAQTISQIQNPSLSLGECFLGGKITAIEQPQNSEYTYYNMQLRDADEYTTPPLVQISQSAKDRPFAVVNDILRINSVAKVQRQGGQEREIHVELDPAKLQIYGITVEFINNQLRQTALTLPAGRIDDGIKETLIRTVGSPNDVETLSNIKISLPDRKSVV